MYEKKKTVVVWMFVLENGARIQHYDVETIGSEAVVEQPGLQEQRGVFGDRRSKTYKALTLVLVFVVIDSSQITR